MSRIETFTLPIAPLEQSPRRIWVCLPDSYDTTKKKYDVLYMFDGHNLFSDKTATYGKSWGIREYLDRTKIDLVVIGQDCSHHGEDRMNEYCPLPVKEENMGRWVIKSQGDFTASWFVNTLKKECEKRYRIYKTREHVGIGGSSMGGLMAEYCITKYNNVFSKAACISPATYFCRDDLNTMIQNTSFKESRIYLDFGTEERSDKESSMYLAEMMLETNHLFEQKGCRTYPHLNMNGTHSEASWEKIVPLMLEYLYPQLY